MSATVLLRCRNCRKGFLPYTNPGFVGCRVCGGNQWVWARRLTTTDRWRLWRQTGLPPWTTSAPLPE